MCVDAPDVPTCDSRSALQPLVSLQHAPQTSVALQFRNGDGDAALELDIARGAAIAEVRGGTAEEAPLLATESDVVLLRAADLDDDGIEELLIAQPTLWILGGSSGEVTRWEDYASAPLSDLAIGTLPNDSRRDASALWACPYLEGCGSPIEIAELVAPGDGRLEFDGNHTITEPMLALDIGRLDDDPNGLVVETADGLVVYAFDSFGVSFPDPAVLGVGVLAMGQLDDTAFDEIVRLSPGSTHTVASLHRSDGVSLGVGVRARFGGELVLVEIGEVDGDGAPDVVMAGMDRIVLWSGPGGENEGGCGIEIVPPHDVRALALGDADGDGVEEIAVAGQTAVTVLRRG